MKNDPMVTDAALRYGIPRALFRALVQVESAGATYAMRYEPGYRWLWDIARDKPYEGEPEKIPADPSCTSATELVGQQTSWGLCQLMGATARELGFKNPFLSALLEPRTNTNYAGRFLVQLYRRFGREHGWEGVAAAYNAGSPRRGDDGRWVNQVYIDRLREAGWEG